MPTLKLLGGILARHFLIFEAHALSHGADLTLGDKLRAFAHGFRERALRHEHIDEPAAESFGSPLQTVQRDVAANFGLLKLNDTRL